MFKKNIIAVVTAVYILFIFGVIVQSSVIPPEEFWSKRGALIRSEEKRALGGELPFDGDERIVNDILMDLKESELIKGFDTPSQYLPGRNFMEIRDLMNDSLVFQIIKSMPKGAVLHAHDTAIVSEDFVYYNITFRDNLYVCDMNDTLTLRFFSKPTNECDWQLLRQVRENKTIADGINLRIRNQLSMVIDHPDSIYFDVDAAWSKFSNIFGFITPILSYKPVYEDHFYQGLKELYEDNVLYLELRSTLPELYELDGTKYSKIEVLNIYKEVTTRFMNDYPDFVGVKIIYAPLRNMKIDELEKFIKLAKEMDINFPNFFAGIDIVGQEDRGSPLSSYVDVFISNGNDIQKFFHAGETNWYGMASDENLYDAILLNSKRIGHGYALVKHPFLLELIKEKDIAVEICPISNQVLGLVKDLRNHPANILFSEGFPIVISNDDPGLWGSKALSYDFYEAFIGMMSKRADIRSLKQLALNSIKYSTMNGEQKERAYQIFSRKWTEFIDATIANFNAKKL